MRDFTICSNTNGFGLQSNVIKDLYFLILHQLVVGWIGKAHGPTQNLFELPLLIIVHLGFADYIMAKVLLIPHGDLVKYGEAVSQSIGDFGTQLKLTYK